jgi:hypothetical protein
VLESEDKNEEKNNYALIALVDRKTPDSISLLRLSSIYLDSADSSSSASSVAMAEVALLLIRKKVIRIS